MQLCWQWERSEDVEPNLKREKMKSGNKESSNNEVSMMIFEGANAPFQKTGLQ